MIHATVVPFSLAADRRLTPSKCPHAELEQITSVPFKTECFIVLWKTKDTQLGYSRSWHRAVWLVITKLY
jgi:hypothetical protein